MINNHRSIKLIVCECMGHAVSLEYDNNDQEIYLSLWEREAGVPRVFNLAMGIERIKLAWRMLRYGVIHSDSVILSYNTAKQLSKSITEITGE